MTTAGHPPDDRSALASVPAPESRPPSLWPDSHGGDAAMPVRAPSHRPPRARTSPLSTVEGRRASAALVARPAVMLVMLLKVQVAVLLAVLAAAPSRREALLQWPLAALTALLGTLGWLLATALVTRRLADGASGSGATRRLPARQRMAALGLGALAGAAASAVPLAFGIGADDGLWQVATLALAGAGLALWQWQSIARQAELARPAESDARLAELQSRIRPHFLFNALNTALALVDQDPGKAETVLEDLSALFRAALAADGQAVTLDDEIDLAQRYLAIERLRFGSRLAVFWDLDPDVAFVRVPPLILQPLVENAVRHGIEPAEGGGSVWIRTGRRQGMVEVEIRNTLPEEPGEPGAGMALDNVRERLKLMHGVAGGLEAGVRGPHFHARLTLPL